MIYFRNFSFTRGTKPLFERVSLAIHSGEKVGLVGANGTGKSTLFSVLRGELVSEPGEVTLPVEWRIAHVSQETPASQCPAIEYVLDGDIELRAIEAQISAAASAGDGTAEALAHVAYADADGYTATARAESLLLGLGFSLEGTRQPVPTFSGGWRMRLNLAQALMCPSDLLLLDEPTNHLDLDTIVWLENWLGKYAGTCIVVSHDREFLDRVCGVTLHVENCGIKRYSGNYSQFEMLRAEQLASQRSLYEKQRQVIAHLSSYIDRFRYKATKARQAQSRIKALERMERVAPVHLQSSFAIRLRAPDVVPNPLLVLEHVVCGYRYAEGENVVIGNSSLSIQNGQRIGLLGMNGQGKSTLVKALAGVNQPLAGEVHRGKGLVVGYFAQHQLETLVAAESPLEHIQRISPTSREQELRSFLGGFNFGGEMVTNPVGQFSGGEKARLALALIIWTKPNLLLLDEPTNHLDLDTRQALTMALAQFEGTIILVSHDRHLLRATTDQFIVVGGGRLQLFDGDLDDYRSLLTSRVDNVSASNTRTVGDIVVKPRKRTGIRGGEVKGQRRKAMQVRVVQLEDLLLRATTERNELEHALAKEGVLHGMQHGEMAGAMRKLGEIQAQVSTLEAEWLEVQLELERNE